MKRRTFVKNSALALGAMTSFPTFSIGQSGGSPNSRLNVACIGVGGRGWKSLGDVLKTENVVALCDVDRVQTEDTFTRASENGYTGLDKIPFFKDYREMFAKMGDQIDAVTVSTPDHHHFPAAMMAIEAGKHILVEKPLTHTVDEARRLREAVNRKGVISQMANQGHATEGIRYMKEWTEAGVLGEVREVVAWAEAHPEAYFRFSPEYPVAEEPIPEGLDWDLWLGPAVERPFSSYYAPRFWRGFWDFGNSTLGDWGCHTLDGPFWALELGAPTRVSAVTADRNSHQPPAWAKITYEFPARGSRPPVKLYWHTGTGLGELAHLPHWPAGKQPDKMGMAMIGSRETLLTNGRPNSPELLSESAHKELRQSLPPKTIPRIKGGHTTEWLDAIKGKGPLPGSNFNYSSALTEMVLLGCIANRTGETLEWDAQAGRITNNPALNQYLSKTYRDGWNVA
jgi:predicted dehydrogenase